MASSMVLRFRYALQTFESKLLQVLGINGPFGPSPALALDGSPPPPNNSEPADIKSLLDSIMDGFMWAAVPKHRRSKERRAIRKLGGTKVVKFMTPKTNIVACLECGHFHEGGHLCGNCYSKVKEETEAMRGAMDETERLFDYPQKEVQFVYRGEGSAADRPSYKGKYIVEMDKPRPDWWPQNMLTKGHGSGRS